MILDETRERFLKAIAREVDLARIAEIHFFAPIRQGGVESGVAVIAAARTVPAPEPVEVGQEPAEEPVEAEAVEQETVEPESADADEPTMTTDGVVNEATLVAAIESEVVELDTPETPDTFDTPERSEPPEPPEAEVDAAEPAPPDRHVIYTARYRLTLKGPDRGKWETNVVAEADAPIITVEVVVRGVQQRAGDVDEPTRMTGDDVRASLPAPTA